METDLDNKKMELKEKVLMHFLEELEKEDEEIDALIEEKVAQRMKLREERLKY